MEIKEISKLIDETELELTPLQRALLSDVNYFNETKGEFVYMESYLEDKYVDVLEGSTIEDEFNQLIELGYVDKYVKRRIYNGKFVTITLLSLTDTFLNNLLSIGTLIKEFNASTSISDRIKLYRRIKYMSENKFIIERYDDIQQGYISQHLKNMRNIIEKK